MDMKSLMRQAQDMQKKMQKLQEEIAARQYEGSAAGGMIKAVVGGDGLAKKVLIDKSLINVDEKEILEDLIIAAFNDAKNKADADSSDSLRSAAGGIPLPPGFKL
jgi:DNA-binding YbaB/EbfC family protein